MPAIATSDVLLVLAVGLGPLTVVLAVLNLVVVRSVRSKRIQVPGQVISWDHWGSREGGQGVSHPIIAFTTTDGREMTVKLTANFDFGIHREKPVPVRDCSIERRAFGLPREAPRRARSAADRCNWPANLEVFSSSSTPATIACEPRGRGRVGSLEIGTDRARGERHRHRERGKTKSGAHRFSPSRVPWCSLHTAGVPPASLRIAT